NPAKVIYVGDETRDIEAARKSKIKAIAVCWGFNFREILAKYKPDFLIDRPSQLLEVVQHLEEVRSQKSEVRSGIKLTY
ncbi:HAD family hydrolase, partial [Merismopedia glauca]